MSDTQNAEPQSPATPAATAAPPVATPAPVNMTSDQLKARLDEERGKTEQRILKALGVEKIDDVKAVLESARKAEDAKKTEAEKLLSRIGELEPAAKKAAEYEAVIKERATVEMQALTDAQRTAVTAIGGDDPAAQLRAITALRPTWATSEPAKTDPKPATTAPATAAPAPAPTTQPTNHRAVYEQMKQTNPMQAAQYLMRHRLEIYPNQ